MDFYKLQKKHKLKEKEIVKEMKIQADKMLDLIGKKIDELGAAERINNLRDITLRNMKVMGMIDEDNKWDYRGIVQKSILVQYWKQRDLPIKERAIYAKSFTDQGLRDQQEETLKNFKEEARAANLKLKTFKQTIRNWWSQRAEEAVDEQVQNEQRPTKGNGKDND